MASKSQQSFLTPATFKKSTVGIKLTICLKGNGRDSYAGAMKSILGNSKHTKQISIHFHVGLVLVTTGEENQSCYVYLEKW